jgi:hypothetical protein
MAAKPILITYLLRQANLLLSLNMEKVAGLL